MRARVAATFCCGVILAAAARPANATFSVAAVDVVTGEVGAAAASCIAPAEVSIVYGPVPGRGVVIAQSFLHQGTLDRGVSLLAAGNAPPEIIASLLDPTFDPDGEQRQLAILDVEGRIAIHTGRRALAFASHRRYAVDDIAFTVQGNRLTGAPVLDRMADAFTASTACDLAGRLVAALLAAPAPGEGDARCTGAGVPADSAFVGVELAGEAPLRLAATQPGVDPLPEIARAFQAFRATHPCPLPADPPAAPEPPPATPDDAASCSIARSASAPASGRPRLELALLALLVFVARQNAPAKRMP